MDLRWIPTFAFTGAGTASSRLLSYGISFTHFKEPWSRDCYVETCPIAHVDPRRSHGLPEEPETRDRGGGFVHPPGVFQFRGRDAADSHTRQAGSRRRDRGPRASARGRVTGRPHRKRRRSEEHTSELPSLRQLVCR